MCLSTVFMMTSEQGMGEDLAVPLQTHADTGMFAKAR